MAKILERNGPNVLARYVVSQVANTLVGYRADSLSKQEIAGQELTVLPHGIDLQPTNIVVAGHGGVFLVDIFPPKEVGAQGNLTTHNPKLDKVSSQALKVACATREGALLRFLRKTQRLWAGDGITSDDFIEEVDEAFGLSGLPADEAKLIIAKMDAGYPLLDRVYNLTTE